MSDFRVINNQNQISVKDFIPKGQTASKRAKCTQERKTVVVSDDRACVQNRFFVFFRFSSVSVFQKPQFWFGFRLTDSTLPETNQKSV